MRSIKSHKKTSFPYFWLTGNILVILVNINFYSHALSVAYTCSQQHWFYFISSVDICTTANILWHIENANIEYIRVISAYVLIYLFFSHVYWLDFAISLYHLFDILLDCGLYVFMIDLTSWNLDLPPPMKKLGWWIRIFYDFYWLCLTFYWLYCLTWSQNNLCTLLMWPHSRLMLGDSCRLLKSWVFRTSFSYVLLIYNMPLRSPVIVHMRIVYLYSLSTPIAIPFWYFTLNYSMHFYFRLPLLMNWILHIPPPG